MIPGRAREARVVLLIAVAAMVLVALVPAARAQGPRILLAVVDGSIGRATVDYLREAIDETRAGGYSALMIRLDTPGGGLDETIELAEMFNNARDVPILGWVGPVGAQAWSAGTILLVATDLAAMDPATTIGSVQPVVIGPGGFEPVTDEKIINAVVNLTRTQLEIHGRNTALADRFVKENLNLNASEALALGAIEIVAESPQQFLTRADGRHIVVQSGTTVYKDLTLSVAGAEIVTFSASARVWLLQIITDPLVASLLLILGIYLVIFGISVPGHGAEIAGMIILLLALIGLGFSVDPIALLLFVIGVVLLIIELKSPGFGVFGTGGIIAIVLAAAFLAPLRPPDFVVSPEYQIFFLAALLTPTGFLGGFLLFAVYKVQQVRRSKPTVGELVGESATVVDGLHAGEKGYVMHRGELWQAISDRDLPADAKVYVQSVDGILLHVSANPPPPPTAVPLRERLSSILRRKLARRPNP